MKVKALKTFTSPHGAHYKGEIFTVPEIVRDDWIGSGLVEPVNEKAKSAMKPATRRRTKKG